VTESDIGTQGEQQTRAVLEVVKAFAVCEHAMTEQGLDGSERMGQLIEAHGMLMAACGPGHQIRFADLIGRVVGYQEGRPEDLLPEWIDVSGQPDSRLIDADGVLTGTGFDFRFEVPRVVRAAQKVGARAGRLTKADIDDEYNQEAVFSAIKGKHYEHHRRKLITNPTVVIAAKADLNLPARAVGFYQPIAQYAQFRGKWWWPCPACRWPMKVTVKHQSGRVTGKVRCLYPWHEQTGASYEFVARTSGDRPPRLDPMFEAHVPDGPFAQLWTGATGQVPEAQQVEGHEALVRAVWRYTVVPGLPELALDRALVAALAGTKWSAVVWPNGDQVDHWIDPGDGLPPMFLADFKDYTWPTQLVRKLQIDGGDRGGAKYLVVPDHRKDQVFQLDRECQRHDMQAVAASEYLSIVIAAAKEHNA
jgi:hypothetical protein